MRRESTTFLLTVVFAVSVLAEEPAFASGLREWGKLHAVEGSELCLIEIVDQDSGWPVPLVELRTTHNVRFVSDNAGLIAFDLPELMGTETCFL